MGEDYFNQMAGASEKSAQKEIVEILLDKDKIELATHFNPEEIILMAILDAWADKPLATGEDLKIDLSLVKTFSKNFKIDRVSLDRKSREEIIKGMLSTSSGDDGIRDKIAQLIRGGM